MAKVFINYRREDSGPYVDRLQDHLEQLFKEGEVFRDVHSIKPGEDFKTAIETAIRDFDYVLVVIGPDWVSQLKKRGARETTDFVRLEIAAALQQGKTIIPITVGGAKTLHEKDLPKTISGLVDRQVFDLSNTHFKNDVMRLIDAMGGAWGYLRVFVELPLVWYHTRVHYYLRVAVKGPIGTYHCLVDSKGKFYRVRDAKSHPIEMYKSTSENLVQNIKYQQKPDSKLENKFLNWKLPPARYKLEVSLFKEMQAKNLKEPLITNTPDKVERSNTKSFNVYNEEITGFKIIVRDEDRLLGLIPPDLKIESF